MKSSEAVQRRSGLVFCPKQVALITWLCPDNCNGLKNIIINYDVIELHIIGSNLLQKRILTTSHFPLLEAVLKSALPSYTIYLISLNNRRA